MRRNLPLLFSLVPYLWIVHLAEGTGQCDESQCRGRRIHPWVDNDTEYTCWVPLDVTARELADPDNGYCTDGYVGRRVEGEDLREVDGELRAWYTCCPPEYDGEVARTCSDTACSSPDWTGSGNCWADGFQEPMTCGNKVFRHPRFTGLQSLIYVQYICCDSPEKNDPLQRELLIARSIWMTLSAITLVACYIFIGGILASRKARSQGYNLYLVFLAIPDGLANITIIVRNALTIPGLPIHPNVFIFVAAFEYFYASANMWLNAVIVAYIHRVLCKAVKLVRVPPPSPQLVCIQAAVVYFVAAGVFGWAFFLYHEGLNVFSLVTVVNVWISTRAVMVGPPLFYILWVCYDVSSRNLLPISGRTRVTALYFLRVIIVFLLTWVPYFIIYEIAWNITNSRTMVYVSYYLGSVQGLVSVVVALSKPDVKRAVLRFLFCRLDKEAEEEGLSSGAGTGGGGSTAAKQSLGGGGGGAGGTTDSDSMTAHTQLKPLRSVVKQPKSMWDKEDVWGSVNYFETTAELPDQRADEESPVVSGTTATTTGRQTAETLTLQSKTKSTGRGAAAGAAALARAARRFSSMDDDDVEQRLDGTAPSVTGGLSSQSILEDPKGEEAAERENASENCQATLEAKRQDELMGMDTEAPPASLEFSTASGEGDEGDVDTAETEPGSTDRFFDEQSR